MQDKRKSRFARKKSPSGKRTLDPVYYTRLIGTKPDGTGVIGISPPSYFAPQLFRPPQGDFPRNIALLVRTPLGISPSHEFVIIKLR